MSNEETAENRRQLSADAQLGLERLIVGRECNAFDRLTVERKARAYAELIRLGLIEGDVRVVEGQAYPEVRVHRVTSLGKKAYGPRKRQEPTSSGAGWKIFLFIVIFAAIVLLVLGVLSNH